MLVLDKITSQDKITSWFVALIKVLGENTFCIWNN